ncbi:MAG: glycerol-3-phosphate acyltransferase [Chloroflexi bacterium]|nr:glycerol-3-phosphate acyltransferase [Chloroflexota bacterium]
MWLNLTLILISYLVGSIPSAYILARRKRSVDIRDIGSRNMGAANTFREIGAREGVAVWAMDVTKGAVPILVAQALGVPQPWVLAAGFAALLGHNFPVYIGFRGGKGAATTMGILLVLAPEAMAITFALLAIPYYFFRRIFIAMCIVGPLLPALIWQFEHSLVLVVYSLVLVVVMGIRNMPNPKEIPALLAKVRNKYITNRYDDN